MLVLKAGHAGSMELLGLLLIRDGGILVRMVANNPGPCLVSLIFAFFVMMKVFIFIERMLKDIFKGWYRRVRGCRGPRLSVVES